MRKNINQLLNTSEEKLFRYIYDNYVEIMFRLCLRYVVNEDDAWMILNNGFLVVFKKIKKINVDNMKGLERWIKKVMINEALKFLRDNMFLNNKKYKEIDQLNISSNIRTDEKLSSEDYYSVLKDLPHGYRTVFNLYAIEGYSHKEISYQLNITESTSRSQLTKARKMLKDLISKL